MKEVCFHFRKSALRRERAVQCQLQTGEVKPSRLQKPRSLSAAVWLNEVVKHGVHMTVLRTGKWAKQRQLGGFAFICITLTSSAVMYSSRKHSTVWPISRNDGTALWKKPAQGSTTTYVPHPGC